MICFALFFGLTVGSVCGKAAAEAKLAYVTVLFRHGDRSPIRAYPTDPYQENAWPQGFGQLTQEGMRQHFELGQFLRKRYKGFLSESYDRHEILVDSTNFDRTLMSAEANLAGLYPPSGQQVFKPDLKWQPIPVHTQPQSQDKFLLFGVGDCPRFIQLIDETKHTEEYINVTIKYQDFIHMLSNKTGLRNAKLESLSSIYDTLFCESRHSMSAPDWVTADVMQTLAKLHNFNFQVIFGLYKQQEKSRLQGGVLLGEILKNLSKMAVSNSEQKLKLMMLSAHDSTVVGLQSSMNVYNGKSPPYASCHMFELYMNDNGSASVLMFYRNDTSVEPYPLQLPGCSLQCPLEDFVRITKPSISDDRAKECQVPSDKGNKEVIVILSVSGCLLLLLIIVLLTIICWQKELSNREGYQHVINEEVGEQS
ncbi:lysosomal acid phosphatase-like isoform X1 [Thalassophryne amazonica]|uniref:lysosomal acid phosphatase-like isoform X1 n=1 Tax=Thalassophryne amazonica TaxID=390379 RepID=UPI0014714329|nr:lysosomal acid phosphatase-like isoform X1 [Thalassophryne amazonica]